MTCWTRKRREYFPVEEAAVVNVVLLRRSPKRRVRMAAELAEALTTELSLTDVVERQRSQQTADRVGSSRRRKEHSVPAGPAIAISTPTLQMARLEGPAHTEEPIELRPFGLSGPSVLVPTEGSEGRSAVEQKVCISVLYHLIQHTRRKPLPMEQDLIQASGCKGVAPAVQRLVKGHSKQAFWGTNASNAARMLTAVVPFVAEGNQQEAKTDTWLQLQRLAIGMQVSSQAKDQQSSASARVSFEQSPAAANMALR